MPDPRIAQGDAAPIPLQDTWASCYTHSWNGIITSESFSHPAKFSRRLIQRIYAHAHAEGWLTRGDWIVDPFSGVSLGAMDALLAGYNVIHCELEPKFHALAQQNVALWQTRHGHLPNYGQAVLVQGDSRQLAQLIQGQVDLRCGSPPYTGSQHVDNRTTIPSALSNTWRKRFGTITDGVTDGQLATLPAGTVEVTLAVSSPPYADGCTQQGHDYHPDRMVGTRTGYLQKDAHNYGDTPGNLAHLAVSSPPYEASWHSADSTDISIERMRKAGYSEAYIKNDFRPSQASGGNLNAQNYGSTTGQLGATQGTTFWEAAKVILEQLSLVLRPGAHVIWVTKNYIRDGQEVAFTADWARLNLACGFEWLHHHRAMLVEDHGTQRDLFGADVVKQTHHKSFFRRLHETKHPDLAINYESVLCFRKPLTAGEGSGATLSVSSPPYAGAGEVLGTHNGIDYSKVKHGGKQRTLAREASGLNYGTHPQNLGNMTTGTPPA